LTSGSAIGHSTNLIGRDSNIIVIRGVNESVRPVYRQMVQAATEFFPESGIVEDKGAVESPAVSRPGSRMSTEKDTQRRHPLQRVESTISSILGANNGDRPGGFVLVIDGGALGHVRILKIFAIFDGAR
jgi:phospholipid-translocating ATPase